jgi:YesN/AraC family two-component response regulator
MRSLWQKHKNRTATLFLLSYLAVMIVPLFVSMGFYYPRMRTMLIDKATQQAESHVLQVKDDMDAQLFNVLSMPTYIFQNKRIILKNLINNPIARLQAKEDMEQMIKTNTFISHLFLYLRDIDYFIVPRSGTFFFQDIAKSPGLYQTSFGDWSKDDLYNILESTDSLRIQPVSSMTIAGIKYDKTLLFVMPFPSKSFARASLMVAVPAGKLNAMAETAGQGEGSFLFYSREGKLLHATSGLSETDQEKLLGALSARSEMNGTLRSMLSGGENIIAWSKSSRYGWQYVQVTPMSLIIGEALALQRSTMLLMGAVISLCFILIYIAMRLNYVPIKRLASLAQKTSPQAGAGKNDFDVIQHLITAMRNEVDQLGRRLNMAEPQMREYLIAKIISGSAKETEQALAQAEGLNVAIRGKAFSVVIAAYESASSAGETCEKLKDDAFRKAEGLIAVQLDAPDQIVLILSDLASDAPGSTLVQRLEGYAYLVMGQTVFAPADISQSYSTAYAALDYVRLKGTKGQFQRYVDLPERVFNPRSYPLEVMQAMETAIAHASCDRLKELTNQVEALLTVEGAPPYFTRSVYFNAINLLISGLMRYLGDGNDTVKQIGLRTMLSHYTIQEMVHILHATSSQLTQIMQENVQKYSPMAQVLTYIDANISSPDLSLQMAADHIGMSSSAFSRSFKEKVGKNFKEYVDAVRILHAKKLLSETELPIEQIASSVGYDTITSFYRMFKNYTGIAPGEYRQTRHS